jgi:hypothetical protein
VNASDLPSDAPYAATAAAIRAAKDAPEKDRAARAKLKPDLGGYRSKLERDYAARLEHQHREGRILWWSYEPMRLRLAAGAYYKPDFMVIGLNGEVEFHETKGFWREAARLRIKVAADQHPFLFVAVKRDKRGWSEEQFDACLWRMISPGAAPLVGLPAAGRGRSK